MRNLKLKNNYREAENKFNSLLRENSKLKTEKANLEKILDEAMVIYDTTKEICKSLDQAQVFIHFRDELTKHIGFGDCRFLKDEAEVSRFKDYSVVPIEIEGRFIGYLAISGVKAEDKDKFHILAHQFTLGMKRAHLYRKVQELAVTDGLTGVFSRRYCLERLSTEITRAKKFNYNFSLLMADIDHFRNYNERYGHLVGDIVLKTVSEAIKENIRQIDLVGRYGGEEFLLILTETNQDEAVLVAERVRQALGNKHIRAYDEGLKVAISIGIAVFPDDSQEEHDLIDKADLALYQAKETGRNKTCVYKLQL